MKNDDLKLKIKKTINIYKYMSGIFYKWGLTKLYFSIFKIWL